MRYRPLLSLAIQNIVFSDGYNVFYKRLLSLTISSKAHDGHMGKLMNIQMGNL
jgi:hypothetical protein